MPTSEGEQAVTTKIPASRVPVTLVFGNLLRNRTRLVVALVGVAFSVFLMVFQASLLIGFIRAASGVIRSVDGAVWIVPRGLPCFDFAARVPRRFADLARQAAGVETVVGVEAGFTDGADRRIRDAEGHRCRKRHGGAPRAVSGASMCAPVIRPRRRTATCSK